VRDGQAPKTGPFPSSDVLLDLRAPKRARTTARWRSCKFSRNRKPRFARLLQSPLTDSNRTRTVDPLLTMERRTQLVAAGGNGFRLFLRFQPSVDLPPVATRCNPGVP
jgi:hypothetical protein